MFLISVIITLILENETLAYSHINRVSRNMGACTLKKINGRSPNFLMTLSNKEAVDIELNSELSSPDKTWDYLEYRGSVLAKISSRSLFPRSVITGMLIGFGGILSASVGHDMGVNPYAPGNGLQRFLCGAIGFPVSNVILQAIGFGTWTGDTFTAILARYNEKISTLDLFRVMFTTYFGSLCGAAIIAWIVRGTGIPSLIPINNIATRKLSKPAFALVIRGILGAFLLCFEKILISGSSTSSGKILGIWLPVSTYVICDFEHYLATFFFLICGLMNGFKAPLFDVIKVLFASSIGNLLGALIMAGAGHFKIGVAKSSIQN